MPSSRHEVRAFLALVCEAIRWATYVAAAATPSRSLRPFEKALDAIAFTVRSGLATFTVPTKLIGVKPRQEVVRAVRAARARFGHRLGIAEVSGRIAVSWDDGRLLGFVQVKHERWLRPLLRAGVRAHLIRVTGDERRGHTLGVNVAIGSLTRALDSMASETGAKRPGR